MPSLISDIDAPGLKHCSNCQEYVKTYGLSICPKCDNSFLPEGVFDTLSKGRKECPECHKYVITSSSTCINCNHEFSKIKTILISDIPVKGKKQCRGCNKYVGARFINCPNCNRPFSISSSPTLTVDDKEPISVIHPQRIVRTNLIGNNLQVISVPGKRPQDKNIFCPAQPTGEFPHTDEEVQSWVEEVIQLGSERGFLYLPEAITYFARMCYWKPLHVDVVGMCPEYLRVKKVIEEHAPFILNRYRGYVRKAEES